MAREKAIVVPQEVSVVVLAWLVYISDAYLVNPAIRFWSWHPLLERRSIAYRFRVATADRVIELSREVVSRACLRDRGRADCLRGRGQPSGKVAYLRDRGEPCGKG